MSLPPFRLATHAHPAAPEGWSLARIGVASAIFAEVVNFVNFTLAAPTADPLASVHSGS